MIPENAVQLDTLFEGSENKIWGSHIVIPIEIAELFRPTDDAKSGRRVVCSINNCLPFQCGILPFGEGRWVIMVNRALQKKLKLEYGDSVKALVWRDDSEYGLPVPEEFEAVFASDDTARAHFDALTDGKKRTLLYIIAKPKNGDLRIRYALAIAQHLTIFNGKIDFKKLNEGLKG